MLSVYGLRILIEVKNAKEDKRQWVDKWRSDVVNTKADAGLYLSLQDTTNINHGPFEMCDKPIPSVILRDVFKRPDSVWVAVHALYEMVQCNKIANDASADLQKRVDELRNIVNGPLSKKLGLLNTHTKASSNISQELYGEMLGSMKRVLNIKESSKPLVPKRRKTKQ